MQDAPPFDVIRKHLSLLTERLDSQYGASLHVPETLAELPPFSERDPWDRPYSFAFRIEGRDRVISMVSSGPDKVLGTADDIVAGTFRRPFFHIEERLIGEILRKQEDFPANAELFSSLLSANGVLLSTLHDPWGTAYRASVQSLGNERAISLLSAGPDRQFATEDDVHVASYAGPYFRRETALMAKALEKAPRPPQNEQEFVAALASEGIDVAGYLDTWNRPYRVACAATSRYSTRVNTSTVRVYGQAALPHTDVTPVTQKVLICSIQSAGWDGIKSTSDDFEVARFPFLLEEETADSKQAPSPASASKTAGTGAMAGLVIDVSGGVVVGAKVTVSAPGQPIREGKTDEGGNYLVGELAAGVYSLTVSAPGFQSHQTIEIPVFSGRVTIVDVELNVGTVSESVSVEAAGSVLQTESASVESSGPMATPRVREYFPETMLWIPEAITDQNGVSRTAFKMPDSVTTWKLAVFASTEDGRVAELESDLRAFQPLFLEVTPPAVLTEGDRIDFPVIARNYQEQREKLALKWDANDWAVLDGPATKDVTIESNRSASVSYPFVAKSIREKATIRVLATGSRARDGIVKTLRVQPDGREVQQLFSDIVSAPQTVPLAIPANAIAGATRSELKIYPNLASLLVESASSLIRLPHGCAEQVISAGYANLVALKFARFTGANDTRKDDDALNHAQYAVISVEVLMGPDGGVSYWRGGEPDVALTAHALSFLVAAREVTAVKVDMLRSLVQWLQKAQGADGSWSSRFGSADELKRGSILVTSLVARALASAAKAKVEVNRSTLASAYHQLALFTDQIDEPYMLAQFTLAALDSGDQSVLGRALPRLVAMAREERGGNYWDLRSNSPFYGWGTAGRCETTGLVVSALSAWRAAHPESTHLDPLIRRGVIFLLRTRDGLGSWYSTQASMQTIRAVVDASALMGKLTGSGAMEVRIGDRTIKRLSITDDRKASDPVYFDLTAQLSPGDTQVELRPVDGNRSVLVYLTTSHWLRWGDTQPPVSPELRFAVEYESREAKAGELLRCSVKAERVGFQGYGMMLAEVGLPPGAEVDRASLDESNEISRYDVLPDRVIFYLWPEAGGSEFHFDLRMRLPIKAKTIRSVLYDYNNPESRSEVAPVLLTVN